MSPLAFRVQWGVGRVGTPASFTLISTPHGVWFWGLLFVKFYNVHFFLLLSTCAVAYTQTHTHTHTDTQTHTQTHKHTQMQSKTRTTRDHGYRTARQHASKFSVCVCVCVCVCAHAQARAHAFEHACVGIDSSVQPVVCSHAEVYSVVKCAGKDAGDPQRLAVLVSMSLAIQCTVQRILTGYCELCVYIRSHVHTRALVCALIHTRTHHARAHTHTRTHTHTRMHTRTHTHTCMYNPHCGPVYRLVTFKPAAR